VWVAKRGEKPVAWADSLAEEARKKQIRAGIRLNSRVELTVEWTESGRTLQAPGYTVDISPKGCLAIVDQGLLIGQRLRLVNGANGNAAHARIIWRGHEGRKGWELGLELESGVEDFWGVEF
jgi:PilZ domain